MLIATCPCCPSRPMQKLPYFSAKCSQNCVGLVWFDDELPSMPFTIPWDIIGQSSTLLLPMAMAVVAQIHLPGCHGTCDWTNGIVASPSIDLFSIISMGNQQTSIFSYSDNGISYLLSLNHGNHSVENMGFYMATLDCQSVPQKMTHLQILTLWG